MTRSKIIYIIGTARSGTTLLDIVLGNANDIFSAGELNRYIPRNGIPHTARDNKVEQFWEDIRDNLKEAGIAKYYKAFPKFEYHTGIFRVLWVKAGNKKLYQKYHDFQLDLFHTLLGKVREGYGKFTVVDSSKYPLRGYFLSKIFGQDISFIHLTRDPLEVVTSFQKRDVEQPSKGRIPAHLYLLFVNLLSRVVVSRIKKRHKVSEISFAELTGNPYSTLEKLESNLNLDLTTPKSIIRDEKELFVGYLFDGNRLRLKDKVKFVKGGNSQPNVTIIDKFFLPIHKLFWYRKG